MTVTLPYPIAVNRIWRNANGRTHLSAEARTWKRDAQLLVRHAGARMIDGPVRVQMTLHPRTTKSGAASRSRLDVDAPIKLTLDALEGVAYADDRQVHDVRSVIGEPMTGGGLTVEVDAA